MDIYLVRHGVAANRNEWTGDDSERPLTPKGKEKMQQEAAGLARMGLGLDAILTSPLVRAYETAEIIAQRLEMMDKLIKDDRLEYGFGRKKLRKILADYPDAQALMLVGHEPDFSKVIGKLIGGGQVVLDKGGVACVTLSDGDTSAGELRWLLTPQALTV